MHESISFHISNAASSVFSVLGKCDAAADNQKGLGGFDQNKHDENSRVELNSINLTDKSGFIFGEPAQGETIQYNEILGDRQAQREIDEAL